MSHPHDGFDWETGVDYEPTGPFFLAWAGDEHNSIMSYIDLNWDFSQFDRDNATPLPGGGVHHERERDRGEILAAKARPRGRASPRQTRRSAPPRPPSRRTTTRARWSHARTAYGHVLAGARRTSASSRARTAGPSCRRRSGASGPAQRYAAFDKIGPGTKRSQD